MKCKDHPQQSKDQQKLKLKGTKRNEAVAIKKSRNKPEMEKQSKQLSLKSTYFKTKETRKGITDAIRYSTYISHNTLKNSIL